MANEIKVNTKRLKDDADKIDGYIKKIETAMKNMKTSVKELDQMWDGTSSEAFKLAINGDINELDAMIKNLKAIYSFETNAKQKYDTCETKVAELVAGIKV